MKPGIYTDLSNEEYHGNNTAISKSGLDLIAKSPAHLKWAQENKRGSTAAMQKGTLIHTMVLEPDKFGSEYVVMPATIKTRRGKAWDEFQLENDGKIIISNNELLDANAITKAVRSNKSAMQILESALAIEESVFSEDLMTGVMCKCRPDIRVDGALYDFKTTKNAEARSFSYSCRTYRYHVQATFYLDVCRNQGIDVDRFGFIAVDTTDKPYQCTVFHQFSDTAIEIGRQIYNENIETYKQCLESGEWPGYPESYDILELAGTAYDDE